MQDRRSREEWRGIVRDFETSGLDAPLFAGQRGVNENTLRWWRSRLRCDADRPDGVAVSPPRQFAPVAVEGWSVGVTPPPPTSIDVAFPNGVRLRFDYGLDGVALRDLAAAFGAVA
jgi:hypothetical protein